MHILTSSDNHYIQHLGVMLVSLLENCIRNKPEEIAVINDNISGENIQKLKTSLLKYSIPIRFIEYENKVFTHLKPKNNKTPAAFHRIFLDEFYHKDVEKVLYLDCDIIIRKNISGLFNTDISEYVLGAVQNDGLHYQDRLGMPPDQLFFNSGVLLVNMLKWRENGVRQKLVHYIKNNFDIMLRNDQDALNAILYDDWLHLSPTWNVHLYFFTSPHLCSYKPDLLREITKDPAVIHYTTQNKPWLYSCKHPFKKEYNKFLRLTEWKDYVPPDLTPLNVFRKSFKASFDFSYKYYKVFRRSIKKLVYN